jgi:hypothetical protein
VVDGPHIFDTLKAFHTRQENELAATQKKTTPAKGGNNVTFAAAHSISSYFRSTMDSGGSGESLPSRGSLDRIASGEEHHHANHKSWQRNLSTHLSSQFLSPSHRKVAPERRASSAFPKKKEAVSRGGARCVSEPGALARDRFSDEHDALEAEDNSPTPMEKHSTFLNPNGVVENYTTAATTSTSGRSSDGLLLHGGALGNGTASSSESLSSSSSSKHELEMTRSKSRVNSGGPTIPSPGFPSFRFSRSVRVNSDPVHPTTIPAALTLRIDSDESSGSSSHSPARPLVPSSPSNMFSPTRKITVNSPSNNSSSSNTATPSNPIKKVTSLHLAPQDKASFSKIWIQNVITKVRQQMKDRLKQDIEKVPILFDDFSFAFFLIFLFFYFIFYVSIPSICSFTSCGLF